MNFRESVDSYIPDQSHGEIFHPVQRRIAGGILLQTMADLAMLSNGKNKHITVLYETQYAIEFIDTDLCKRCCEAVGVNYNYYYEACLHIYINTNKDNYGGWRILARKLMVDLTGEHNFSETQIRDMNNALAKMKKAS